MKSMRNVRVPHPIPYQGSKRIIAPDILCYFPTDVQTLYEPFAGSGAVSLAAAATRRATRFVLSDSNAALVALWDEIINRPNAIARAYEDLWHAQSGSEREFYDTIRREFNCEPRPDRFLYLLVRCVKASVRYNAYGEFNQSPDNRRKGTRPSTMASHIHSASLLLKGRAIVQPVDYTHAIRDATCADLIYMDPPYQGVCGTRDPRYLKDVRFEEFAGALAEMNDRGLSYIVSYDGHNSLRSYGQRLPECLELEHIYVHAGRSTQATLLGRDAQTVESLYLSPALSARLHSAQLNPTLEICA